jgi:hypothetical protein
VPKNSGGVTPTIVNGTRSIVCGLLNQALREDFGDGHDAMMLAVGCTAGEA